MIVFQRVKTKIYIKTVLDNILRVIFYKQTWKHTVAFKSYMSIVRKKRLCKNFRLKSLQMLERIDERKAKASA